MDDQKINNFNRIESDQLNGNKISKECNFKGTNLPPKTEDWPGVDDVDHYEEQNRSKTDYNYVGEVKE